MLTGGYFLWSIAYFFFSFLLYYKEKKKIIYLSICCIIVSLSFKYLLIKSSGIEGAAQANIYCYGVVLLITLFFINFNQKTDKLTGRYNYLIEDVGDLQGWFSYEEINATGYKLILTQPLIINQNADFILQDQLNTVLCIENGCITTKNL